MMCEKKNKYYNKLTTDNMIFNHKNLHHQRSISFT